MKKEEFEYMVNRCYTMYMQQNNNVLFNLLDSHDTERLINRLHNLDIFLPAAGNSFYTSRKSMYLLRDGDRYGGCP